MQREHTATPHDLAPRDDEPETMPTPEPLPPVFSPGQLQQHHTPITDHHLSDQDHCTPPAPLAGEGKTHVTCCSGGCAIQ